MHHLGFNILTIFHGNVFIATSVPDSVLGWLSMLIEVRMT